SLLGSRPAPPALVSGDDLNRLCMSSHTHSPMPISKISDGPCPEIQGAISHSMPLVAEKLHARDYLRHAHDHRTACNSVYVAWPSDEIFTELQVRTGDCPLPSFTYRLDGQELQKIPDLIAGSEQLTWIEVENSWRSDKDLSKVIACLRAMFSDELTRIDCMHFVVTVEGAKTIGKRLKKKLTHGPESGWSAPVRALDARILGKHIKVSVLDQDTLMLAELCL
ncbi:hypothetical protein, partial [Comamonas thiooxydans]|uniref:hypothetical protein n=3 Tax=Comamonas thiooxydans TaxID=363952 RepID=UPI00265FE880